MPWALSPSTTCTRQQSCTLKNKQRTAAGYSVLSGIILMHQMVMQPHLSFACALRFIDCCICSRLCLSACSRSRRLNLSCSLLQQQSTWVASNLCAYVVVGARPCWPALQLLSPWALQAQLLCLPVQSLQNGAQKRAWCLHFGTCPITLWPGDSAAAGLSFLHSASQPCAQRPCTTYNEVAS